MDYKISPDDMEDHWQESDEIMGKIEDLLRDNIYQPSSIALSFIKMSALLAIRASVSQQDFTKICGDYYKFIEQIIDEIDTQIFKKE